MHIRLLNVLEFDAFASIHPLRTYQQSTNYAMLMVEKGYDYDLIGYVDEKDNIIAASLIVIKTIGTINKYGYAPKGFLIDYYNKELLKSFVEDLKKYYYKKNISFIKINPDIAIGEIKDNKIEYNQNAIIKETLNDLDFVYIGDNLLFETMQPRFNAIISLKNYFFDNLSKPTRNKIRKGEKKGLSLLKVDRDNIDIIYNFIKNKKNKDINYYKNCYNIFSKTDQIDLFLVKIDFEKALINCQETYEQEEEKNNALKKLLTSNPSEDNIKNKMNSDIVLTKIKNDIIKATQDLSQGKEKFIAGAITIKYQNRIYILISGYDKKYNRYSPNYYLHHYLCEYYKNNYDFIDLNGITGDFSKNNPYHGLNQFKLGFKPKIFEYIGEYDLIINKGAYKVLKKNNFLTKEFKRKTKI